MLLIVGQGNPGAKYAETRHNIGFQVLDEIASFHNFGPWKKKFQGVISEGLIPSDAGSKKCLLLKPDTFYNETGRSVSEAARFYKLDADQIIVFHDEIDLAPGRVRQKKGGGHSGNNGIRSIMAHMGADIRRVRLGVGHPGDKSRVTGYVLSDFAKSELQWRDDMLRACAKSIGFVAQNDDERFQTEVMRLAPAPKADPKKSARKAD